MELVIFLNDKWLHKLDLPDGDIRLEIDKQPVYDTSKGKGIILEFAQ